MLHVVQVALNGLHRVHHARLLLFKLRLLDDPIGHRFDERGQLLNLLVDHRHICFFI